jgi:putative MFS transporter
VRRYTPYQWRLFVFLSIATFFEGYDFIALSQILPNLRDAFDLSETQGGVLGSVISLGTIVSYVLVRMADRWGRRRVLLVSIGGYALFTFCSGLAPTATIFASLQFVARVFLIAQWAVGMIFAAEEFPAERRAFVLGVIQAANALGVIACAAVVPWLLATPFGWRTVYFVGVLPVLLLPYARTRLKETALFTDHLSARPTIDRRPLAIFRTPYRGRVVQMAFVWGLTYMSTNTALLFWKEFAVAERGFTDHDVGRAVVIASLVALPFVFSIGRVIDHLGRRRSAALIYPVGMVAGVLAYQLQSFWALTVCLTVALIASIGVLTLLNALTTELFPTSMRADAFSWTNNLLGRIGYVIAPGMVGALADRVGWGTAVPLTSIALLMALGVILTLIPETGGKELEEASQL